MNNICLGTLPIFLIFSFLLVDVCEVKCYHIDPMSHVWYNNIITQLLHHFVLFVEFHCYCVSSFFLLI